ncbi:MAG TPA: hypothetical protein VG798_07115 [Rhizomicrobium sp.]|nr:hypothetical protein [Rhizomicrobium sp.]
MSKNGLSRAGGVGKQMVVHPKPVELATKFFVRFARFENALKRTGFRKAEKNDGVSADWDAFAHEPEIAALFNGLQANPVSAYIINLPPKKRVMVNGVLDWRDVKQPVNMVELVAALNRMRNNLFHGDKQNPNLSRNAQLLTAGVEIIDAMLGAHPMVRQEYEGMQEIA